MTIEYATLLTMSILATIKAYFEWKKANAESVRADNTEDLLKHTIKSVEVAKNNLDINIQKEFAKYMRKYIESSSCDTHQIHCVVKEVTEGEGDIRAMLS